MFLHCFGYVAMILETLTVAQFTVRLGHVAAGGLLCNKVVFFGIQVGVFRAPPHRMVSVGMAASSFYRSRWMK